METSSSELINTRFEEHRRRQGLVNTNLPGGGGGGELEQDVSLDTGDEVDDKREGHPPTTAYTSTASTGEDKSRKGSIDERIKTLVFLINSTDNFFTTSTCSGRIIIFTNESVKVGEEEESSSEKEKSVGPIVKKIKKQGCKWLLVSHDEVTIPAFFDAWKNACTSGEVDVSFKMEAAILHIQCRKLSDAKKLIHAGTESGFRNCGMVIGKDNRITVAVRSALGYEVPLLTTIIEEDGTSAVSDEYLTYLVEKANEKMKENWRRMDKFTEEFRKTFT